MYLHDIDTQRTYYNYDNTKMYVEHRGHWKYMPPNGSNAESGPSMYIGEAAFYIYYGMKFYGSRVSGFTDRWYSQFD